MKNWALLIVGSFIGFCIGSVDDDVLNRLYSIVVIGTLIVLAAIGLTKTW